ncbi:hypothetical protein JOF55_003722 [Haloactinomyces albus]|uniref:Uncharacterized protein n=1 Tax=Haloactinomyces albus TaxID=1352928 RepID=A0AAE3ZGM1_9ACTN|nr:hypothetical protein [Haloactinomyces albus]
MILTTTLNAALEITYEVAALSMTQAHRAEKVRTRAGCPSVSRSASLTMPSPDLTVRSGCSSLAPLAAEASWPPRVAVLTRRGRARIVPSQDCTPLSWVFQTHSISVDRP